MKKKASKQALINLPHHFFHTFFFIIQWYFIAKVLIQTDWGSVNTAFFIIMLLWMIAGLWLLETYGLYLLEKKDNEEEQKNIIWFWLYILWIIIGLFIVFNLLIAFPVTYFFFNDKIFYLILIWIFISWAFILKTFVNVTNKYIWKIHYNAFFEWWSIILWIIWIYFLYLFWLLNIITLFLINYIIYLIVFIPYFFLWKVKIINFKQFKVYLKKFKTFFKHWFDVYMSKVLTKSSVVMDKIILWIFNTAWVILIKILNTFFYPLINFWADFASAKIIDFKQWENIDKKSIIWIILSWLIYWILFYFLSEFLIKNTFWDKYLVIKDYIIFVVINWIFSNITLLFYYYLHIHKEDANKMKYKILIRLLLNIIFSFIFIPFLWIVGAFLSLILTKMFILTEYYIMYKKHIRKAT